MKKIIALLLIALALTAGVLRTHSVGVLTSGASGGGGAAAWTPNSISGLVLWIDVAQSCYSDAGATTACSDGETGIRIKDLSTYGTIFTGSAPYVANSGDPYFNHHGAGPGFWQTVANVSHLIFTSTDAYSMGAHVYNNVDGAGGEMVEHQTLNVGLLVRFYGTSRVQLRFGEYAATNEIEVASNTNNSGAFAWLVTYSGNPAASNVKTYINGVDDTPGSYTDNITGGWTEPTAQYEFMDIVGRLRRLVIYNKELSSDERTLVSNYLVNGL